MLRTGIVDLCRECEEKEGGSCCGAGLENHYSGMLLLINRLLGVALRTKGKNRRAAFFSPPRMQACGTPRALHQLRLQQDYLKDKPGSAGVLARSGGQGDPFSFPGE